MLCLLKTKIVEWGRGRAVPTILTIEIDSTCCSKQIYNVHTVLTTHTVYTLHIYL